MDHHTSSPSCPPLRQPVDKHFADCMCSDKPRLRALYRKHAQNRDPQQRITLSTQLSALQAQSTTRFQQRQQTLPTPEFPAELPVCQQLHTIQKTLRTHQVIILCGETGSGKTTQLPKICLSLGRGIGGLIGHTQPRRLAARATARRIGDELGNIPDAVAYKIRFTDHSRPGTFIKVMTDGILLAETQGDPLLNAYDTLIIDEAHERSLNIDFLLGYLKTLLPRRPDLKLIITSATLEAERFARHFTLNNTTPPVIEVSGRLYPIELRYRPPEAPGRTAEKSSNNTRTAQTEIYDAIADAVDEARSTGPGDILVFLPGEREIRESAEALRKASHAADCDILPLYARQSAQEQGRIFAPANKRKIVLATNVAETSLTVPGIRFVIDCGLARVKRYSHRNKVEQLQIEPISQAAASQRAGRCGRVMDGICIRLYSEEDFNTRPPHTDPEILRSSLAGVILRMKALKLQGIEQFPFIDAPSQKMINDGYQLLQELGAIDDTPQKALTRTGEELSHLPLDPKIGSMILAARRHGCLTEALVITSALSIQDPRERPQNAQAAADQAHATFRGQETDRQSEFLWYHHVWQQWQEIQRHQSGNKQKAWCRQHFLSWLRMRQWQDTHQQLALLCKEHGWKTNQQPAHYDAIHKALLTGLLGHIGCKADPASDAQNNTYQGVRSLKFWPHLGSALARKASKWIMAAELIDTSRLFARCLARIEPQWIEEVGAHLIRHHLYDPHWSKKQGAVQAWQDGTLYGLTIFSRRTVSYNRIEPALCRTLLIREGLTDGGIEPEAARGLPFYRHNQSLADEIRRMEEKTRRPDVLVDDALIHAFYDQHLPDDAQDLRSLTAWYRRQNKTTQQQLFLTREQLMRHDASGITSERFPATIAVLGQPLTLSYSHSPSHSDDGVTLHVPLPMINQIPTQQCEWLVPGLLEQKILALLKAMPQKHRHRLQPLAESTADFLQDIQTGDIPTNQSLLHALQCFVEERIQLKLPLDAIRQENLPPFLQMNFCIEDSNGQILGKSRHLAELRQKFGQQATRQFNTMRFALENAHTVTTAQPTPATTKTTNTAAPIGNTPTPSAAPSTTAPQPNELLNGLTSWSFGELPDIMEVTIQGHNHIGFPALHDDSTSVSLRPYDTQEEAARIHRQGLLRLFALTLKEQIKSISKLPALRTMTLDYMPFGSEEELRNDLIMATLAQTCLAQPWPQNATQFTQRCQQARPRITLVAQELLRLCKEILQLAATVRKRLNGLKTHTQVCHDIEQQLSRLLPKHFLLLLPWERLQHLPRYLKAIDLRLDKLRKNPVRDETQMAQWQTLAQTFERDIAKLPHGGADNEFIDNYRWLLEELRVSLFAQELKTPIPVSIKRLEKIWHSRPR